MIQGSLFPSWGGVEAPRRRPDWARLEAFGLMVQAAQFRFAVTMKANPHNYTHRETWPPYRPFEEPLVWPEGDPFTVAARTVQETGYKAVWKGHTYVQLDCNEHFYWTMGAHPTITYILNRKPLFRHVGPGPWHEIGWLYDVAFRDEADRAVEGALVEAHGPLEGDVLEVGCGTGRLLEGRQPMLSGVVWSYLGIDPSLSMVQEFRRKFPQLPMLAAPLAAFAPPEGPDGGAMRYDVVRAPLGTGSFLSLDELDRIPLLLKPGGRASVSFYRAGKEPEVFKRTRTKRLPHREWAEGLFPGEPVEVGPFVVVNYQNEG